MGISQFSRVVGLLLFFSSSPILEKEILYKVGPPNFLVILLLPVLPLELLYLHSIQELSAPRLPLRTRDYANVHVEGDHSCFGFVLYNCPWREGTYEEPSRYQAESHIQGPQPWVNDYQRQSPCPFH
jgi:hypothetical protein